MCKACEERRKKLLAWKEKALESYRKLIGGSSSTVKSADRTEHNLDKSDQPTVSSDPVTTDGNDA